jgi:hypothetical protein
MVVRLFKLMVMIAVSVSVPSEAWTVSAKLGVVSKSSTVESRTVIWPVAALMAKPPAPLPAVIE